MTASKSASEPARALRRIRIAGLVGALVGALLMAALGGDLRRSLFDGWQRLSPRDLSDTQVRVVEIDAESLDAVGGWPWSRYHVARLTEQIAARRPAAIGFDIIFAKEDPLRPEVVAGLYPELDAGSAARLRGLTSNDDVLGDVLGRTRPVLARAGADEGGADPAELNFEAEVTGRLPPEAASFRRATVSIPQLEFVALGFGLIGVEPDVDGVIRQVPMIGRLGDQAHPALSLDLVRVARNQPGIKVAEDAIQVGDRRIPVDRQGEVRLHFGTFPRQATIPAVDLLRKGLPADEIAGKVVLVGLAAEGAEDVVTTPVQRATFGIYTHAQAVDAILRGSGWLERPAWAAPVEWAVGILIVLLVVYALPRRGPLQFLVPAALVLLVGASWTAFQFGSLLLDPIGPSTLGTFAAFGVGLASLGETRRERERLREALVQERIAAARVEEEMNQARSIQESMLPPPGYLAGLDPRLEIAAVLEPARSVGGDFFDAVRLDADRIAFCIADVTGKGVPAALFMALSKALSRSVILREANLESAATLLNEELSRDEIDSGVTMLIGIVDLTSGELSLVNAGHDNPFLLAGGEVVDFKMDGGPPFCIVDFPWPIVRVPLAPGEGIVLVTDGVAEAQDGKGGFYGRERARETLIDSAATDAAGIAAALVAAVRRFEAGAEPSDDLTVMVLRYRG
jgi:serine phosphatase RsbU (regulator of sigma subunit)/CHASE2 domain-containing sensor protein